MSKQTDELVYNSFRNNLDIAIQTYAITLNSIAEERKELGLLMLIIEELKESVQINKSEAKIVSINEFRQINKEILKRQFAVQVKNTIIKNLKMLLSEKVAEIKKSEERLLRHIASSQKGKILNLKKKV